LLRFARRFQHQAKITPFLSLSLLYSLINLALFSATVFQSWRSRHLSTEFQESQYILRALIGILLVAFIGVPVLIIARDNPNSRLFVTSGIIFAICSLILLLIFVPKIQYEKSGKSERPGLSTHISGLDLGPSVGTSIGVLNSAVGRIPESVNLSRPSLVSATDDESESGERILSIKTQRELVSEVAALKRYIRLLKSHLDTKGTTQSFNNTNDGSDADTRGHRSSVHFIDLEGEHDDLGISSVLLCSDDAIQSPLELGGTAANGHDTEKTSPPGITTISNSDDVEDPDADGASPQRQDPESHPLSANQP
jgi:hypothetical protein